MHGPFHLHIRDVQALGDGEALVHDDVITGAAVRRSLADLDAFESIKPLSPAGMGKSAARDTAHRGDRTGWVSDADPALFGDLRDLFEGVRRELNEVAWLGLSSYTVQLAVYPGNGSRYVRHCDALAGDAARRATSILYLNPDWVEADGGCLRVYSPSGQRDIQPLGGRLVVFFSDRVPHEVLPSNAVRRAATCWYRSTPLGVPV